MHDHRSHRARLAADAYLAQGLPLHRMRRGQHPVRRNQHAMAFPGQVGQGRQFAGICAIVGIGDVGADHDGVRRQHGQRGQKPQPIA
jgi:hypothetical protein